MNPCGYSYGYTLIYLWSSPLVTLERVTEVLTLRQWPQSSRLERGQGGRGTDLCLLDTYRDFCEIFLIQGHNLPPLAPTDRKVKTCKHQSNSYCGHTADCYYLSLPVEHLADQVDTEDELKQLL